MIKLNDSDWKPVEDDLVLYFWESYFAPMLAVLDDQRANSIYNSRSALVSAIRKGTVKYQQGVFTGQFNSRISRELSKFAEYDGRSKTWRGIPPADVSAAAIVANTNAENTNNRLLEMIDQFYEKVKETVQQLSFNIDRTINKIDKQLEVEVRGVTVLPEITEGMRERYNEEYTENMKRNIVNEGGPGNWNEEQVIRLRDAVERNLMRGSNKAEMQEMIMSEWGVSQRKAKFLARQETSLFLATMRDDRYQSSGIERWRWSATGGKSGDGRTRDLHRELHGQVFTYSSPPIIDERTGERGMPGQAFGCRCQLIPVL